MPHKFTDSAGKEWSISLNLGEAKRIKDAREVDLLDATNLQRLASDPYLLGDVLYLVCESQAAAAGIDSKQFGEQLAGDAIDAAADAFLAELVDFFPKRQREALKSLLATIQGTQADMANLATEKANSPAMAEAMQRTRRAAEAEIDRLLAEAGKSYGSVSG